MGRQNLATIADLDRARFTFDDGVLLDQLDDFFFGMTFDGGRAEVARDRLRAGIENVAIRFLADNGGQNRQGAAELRPDRVVSDIHENEGARLDFSDAFIVADELPGAGT